MTTVRTDLLAAVAKWAHADPARPIGAVLFRDNRIIATDGHRLVIVPHELEGEAFGVARYHLRAAIAAQNALTREPIDPQVGYDVKDVGDVVLADGPYGDREITLTTKEGRVYLEIADGVAIRVPAHDVSTYADQKRLDSLISGGSDTGTPDGYLLNPEYLADVSEVSTASATYRDGVWVTRWSRLDKKGGRSPLVMRNKNGVLFAIMPMREESKP